MCGRLACTLCPEEISRKFEYESEGEKVRPRWVESSYEYKPTFNGPPSTVVPVLLSKRKLAADRKEDLPDRCLIPMRWGMLTDGKGGEKTRFHTHNARLENVFQSPLYAKCLQKRCVILAEGFYEWQTTGKDKQPYYLYQKPYENDEDDKYLMKFAGLFNTTVDDSTGRTQYSCSMLTTEANEEMSWLHHRVPVVLNTDEEVEDWLGVLGPEAVKGLPKYSDFGKTFKFLRHPVNKDYVNKVGVNEAKCMQKMTNKRKSSTLDAWLKKPKK